MWLSNLLVLFSAGIEVIEEESDLGLLRKVSML